ncbi:hypothetical protein PENTCL1PPCAC_26045, partial [Pristionchus entomophagus]
NYPSLRVSMTSSPMILLLCLIATAAAGRPWMFFGRPKGGLVNGPFHLSQADAVKLSEGQTLNNFSQRFDHFDQLDTKKWIQRYYYNARFANRDLSSGQDIIFLMIGGEGKEPPKWSGDENMQIMQFAKLFGATVFDLEHRFFGPSRPINNLKTESLRLLTMEQALADLAYFITSMNKEHNYNNPKWITFGGSYPGALSAMFRSRYPELTAGAVASSAPINFKLDFYEYADVVQSVLSQTPIANDDNVACDELVRRAISQMQGLSMTREGRNKLNDQMHLDPAFDEYTDKKDINNFFGNVYNIFQGMIQYTYDGRNEVSKQYSTARQACDIMNKKGDLIDNVWELAKFEADKVNGDPIVSFSNNYTADMESLKETDYDILGEGAASYKGWYWLLCNEMGYMQTTDGDSIFGSTIPINLFYDMCMDMFGPEINAPYTRDANRATNDAWNGVDDFDATNLCLPNGKFDPWSALGYYGEDKKRNILPVVIEGAAHCSDMYPEYDGEPAALPAARQKIRDFLSGLIYDANHPQPHLTSSSEAPTDQTDQPDDSSSPSPPTSTTVISTTSSSATPFSFAILLASSVLGYALM